jgi:hypothetical protein
MDARHRAIAREQLLSGLWPHLERCHGDSCQQDPTGSPVGVLLPELCISDSVPSPAFLLTNLRDSLF